MTANRATAAVCVALLLLLASCVALASRPIDQLFLAREAAANSIGEGHEAKWMDQILDHYNPAVRSMRRTPSSEGEEGVNLALSLRARCIPNLQYQEFNSAWPLPNAARSCELEHPLLLHKVACRVSK